MNSEKIQELSKIYKSMEEQYIRFSHHFDNIQVETNELPGIPVDVAKVIKGMLGMEKDEWANKIIPALDYQRVVDLVKTEEGQNAVKIILIRMP